MVSEPQFMFHLGLPYKSAVISDSSVWRAVTSPLLYAFRNAEKNLYFPDIIGKECNRPKIFQYMVFSGISFI